MDVGLEEDASSRPVSWQPARSPDSNGASSSTQNIKEKEMQAMLEAKTEPEEPAIMYCIFYLLGMGTLLPWNFFITASSYWNYKFRDTTVQISANQTQTQTLAPTDLQYNFFAYLAVASMVPNTIFLTLNAIFAHLIRQQLKLVVALSIVIIFFILTTILVPVNADDWQSTFFAITMVVVVIVNVGAAVFQGGLFGLSAQFPPKFLSAVLSGQALGAVFACLCRIVSIAVSGDDLKTAAINSALVYFTLADVVLIISLCCYLWMTRAPFYRHYTGKHGPDRTVGSDGEPRKSASLVSRAEPISVWAVFLKIKWYALSVVLVFSVTLAMFPAITAKIRPMSAEDSPAASVWARDYFVPVCCFLLFNVTDFLGRISGGYTIWPKRHQWYVVLVLVLLRAVFVPLFMYCNVAHRRLTTVFDSDGYYVLFMSLFGLTNGYLATLCMIYGPGLVEPSEQNTASSMMAAFLGLGLCVGAALSNAAIKVI